MPKIVIKPATEGWGHPLDPPPGVVQPTEPEPEKEPEPKKTTKKGSA